MTATVGFGGRGPARRRWVLWPKLPLRGCSGFTRLQTTQSTFNSEFIWLKSGRNAGSV